MISIIKYRGLAAILAHVFVYGFRPVAGSCDKALLIVVVNRVVCWAYISYLLNCLQSIDYAASIAITAGGKLSNREKLRKWSTGREGRTPLGEAGGCRTPHGRSLCSRALT